ncbi:hypothetical protein JOF29_007169 [Kribbella aluminosa]|uniref:Uncharacterized protein n=1 Tax=Kribbella aluminosa TaxID=416017 RepID=A0ABS4UWN8_9ACTN|nr:hypothetical protein [Kribbella aluminosa]
MISPATCAPARAGAVYSDKHDNSYNWNNYLWQRTFA